MRTVLQSAWYAQASRISVYLSTPTGEIQTDELIQRAFQAGTVPPTPSPPLIACR